MEHTVEKQFLFKPGQDRLEVVELDACEKHLLKQDEELR